MTGGSPDTPPVDLLMEVRAGPRRTIHGRRQPPPPALRPRRRLGCGARLRGCLRDPAGRRRHSHGVQTPAEGRPGEDHLSSLPGVRKQGAGSSRVYPTLSCGEGPLRHTGRNRALDARIVEQVDAWVSEVSESIVQDVTYRPRMDLGITAGDDQGGCRRGYGDRSTWRPLDVQREWRSGVPGHRGAWTRPARDSSPLPL